MTFLVRDQDMIKYQTVKKVFEIFDQDQKGMITEFDIRRLLNPFCSDNKLSKQMFKEVSMVLKTDVQLTGINMDQFRNVLLHEMTVKRGKLTKFMEANKSMTYIKECRELIRLN